MPQDPNTSLSASVELDDSKKWVVKLSALDESPSQYRDRRKNAMMLTWRFLVYDPDTGLAVEDEGTGQLFELWHFTGDLTYDNEASGGGIAPAREVANALCGKRLDDDEIRQMNVDGWGPTLQGKYATADLEWGTTKQGYPRLNILRLRPYRKAEPAPAPAAAPEPEPVAAAAPASRRARVSGSGPDDELPF
jgi:hypothetical protein